MAKKIKVSFSVDDENYKAFTDYCDKHGVKYSFLIDKFMEEQNRKE